MSLKSKNVKAGPKDLKDVVAAISDSTPKSGSRQLMLLYTDAELEKCVGLACNFFPNFQIATNIPWKEQTFATGLTIPRIANAVVTCLGAKTIDNVGAREFFTGTSSRIIGSIFFIVE